MDASGAHGGDKRLSWHLNSTGGYRAGRECGLNGSCEWLNVVYYRRGRHLG